MRAYIVAAVLVLLCGTALPAAKTLDVYVIDADGGKAMLVVTPSGQSLVVDAGYAGFINEKSQVVTPNDLDADRIIRLVKLAKVKQIDYMVVTHYHNDHAENVPKFVAKVGIPVRNFVDHGPPLEQSQLTGAIFKAYTDSIGKATRITVKPGDTIPLKGVEVEVLTAAGQTIESPLAGAGAPNELCGAAPARPDRGENPASVGLLYTFGKFRMIDLADLTKGVEYKLMCPNNRVGTVDLYMVSHHGWDLSNSALLVHALRPRVAIMYNGAKKGNMPAVVQVLRSSPGLEDVWQMHYTPSGKVETDRSQYALKFCKERPKHEARVATIINRGFRIPPGDSNYRLDAAFTAPQDLLVYSFSPHMHLRGKDFEFRAVYPDGRREILLSVPQYDFNWQNAYRPKEPLRFPAGTRIECTAHYDNSKGNPANPDPKKAVTWGDQTWEEMMIGYMDCVLAEPGSAVK